MELDIGGNVSSDQVNANTNDVYEYRVQTECVKDGVWDIILKNSASSANKFSITCLKEIINFLSKYYMYFTFNRCDLYKCSSMDSYLLRDF